MVACGKEQGQLVTVKNCADLDDLRKELVTHNHGMGLNYMVGLFVKGSEDDFGTTRSLMSDRVIDS